ncbi:cytochrome P450 [Phenylobacterium sp.]|uniref:cytochrome P450 n=1 Tax=Phenylobacterium sp. TaxID=1871053 RepID=UPI002737A430|nr:cytochrome P450 [Phenylobacterium sp.]MDP3866802.1 cytochrome P450 [Phenylobacterium sp.]
MADGARIAAEARDRAYSTPLEDFHVGDPELFRTDTHWPWFERLRAEDPVHYCKASDFGPYWSVTKFDDIVAVDGDHNTFSSSSERGGIALGDSFESAAGASFISQDSPRHEAQRRVVAPMFTSGAMAAMEPLIRSRAAAILDELPVGETFDFVDRVSVELTAQMLATLMDFPVEERRLLPRASDLLLAAPILGGGSPAGEPARQAELMATFTRLVGIFAERAANPRNDDLISMLAHDPATNGGGDPYKYVGNLVLLIVAGSDTTRHSITGGLLALNENPEQYAKLREDSGLIAGMVPEIIRYQSPVAHMRRTALADATIGGKTIKAGEKVIMWYVSGNRDACAIENPDAFIIDRERPRQHVAFGFGVHRCVGQRLAEMQLRVVWEEMMKRFPFIEVVGEPRRLTSNFVKGYEYLPVRIPG